MDHHDLVVDVSIRLETHSSMSLRRWFMNLQCSYRMRCTNLLRADIQHVYCCNFLTTGCYNCRLTCEKTLLSLLKKWRRSTPRKLSISAYFFTKYLESSFALWTENFDVSNFLWIEAVKLAWTSFQYTIFFCTSFRSCREVFVLHLFREGRRDDKLLSSMWHRAVQMMLFESSTCVINEIV